VSIKNQNDDLLSRLEKGNELFQEQQARNGVGCPKCNYRTFTMEDGKVKHCTCWNKQTIERKCRAANIPQKYIGMTLEDDWHVKNDANGNDAVADFTKKTKIKRAIAQYTQNLTRLCAGLTLRFPNGDTVQNLLIVGESSSGKTLLGAIIAQEAVSRGLSTVFIDWVELEPVFADFDAREEQNRIVEECKAADVVIIDGVENLGIQNAYFMSGLERIASARINKGSPTIITAFENYVDIRGKHNWTSLIGSAKKIHLPPPVSKNNITLSAPSNNLPSGRFRKSSDRLATTNEGE
jgi:DNA replication protein DnaC